MKHRLLAAAAAAILSLAAPASAAQIGFELNDFEDAFADPSGGVVPASVSGRFTYDTTSMALSAVKIWGGLDTYTSGQVLRGTGFGFADAFFVFKNGANAFFFDLADLDLDSPGIAPGETRVFDTVIALESDDYTPDYVINDGTFYVGRVDMRLQPSAVPLPASLPLFAVGLGLMGFVATRRKSPLA